VRTTRRPHGRGGGRPRLAPAQGGDLPLRLDRADDPRPAPPATVVRSATRLTQGGTPSHRSLPPGIGPLQSYWSRKPLFFPSSAAPRALSGWRLIHARPAWPPPRPVAAHRGRGVAAPRPTEGRVPGEGPQGA